MLAFILLTGIADYVMYVFYMLPYLFVGIVAGNIQSSGETSLAGFVLLMLAPATVYSVLFGLAGYLLNRTQRQLN